MRTYPLRGSPDCAFTNDIPGGVYVIQSPYGYAAIDKVWNDGTHYAVAAEPAGLKIYTIGMRAPLPHTLPWVASEAEARQALATNRAAVRAALR